MTGSESRPVVIIGLGRQLAGEHRVRTQVRAFTGRHPVHGYGLSGLSSLDEFRAVGRPPRILYRIVKLAGAVFPRLRIWFESFWYRGLADEVRQKNPRLIIAHDIVDALIATRAGLPYAFDSHEYLPRQFDGTRLWRVTEIRYRRTALKDLFPRASIITVEGETVGNAYEKEFPATRGRILVVRNTPAYVARFNATPAPTGQRSMIHHGYLVPERGLELYFDIMERLGPRYRLTLMGGGSNAAYIAQLKERADRAGNIVIREPVPFERIVETLHGYDLGFVFFGSRHYHHKYMTVPNKFWECLQARVPVVVSPEGAMAAYVREHGVGIVPQSNTVDGYVEAIEGLSDKDIATMKATLESMALAHSIEGWIDGYTETLLKRVPESNPGSAAMSRR
jgi:glycosyltransferase involved in cell wall biosynthesis